MRSIELTTMGRRFVIRSWSDSPRGGAVAQGDADYLLRGALRDPLQRFRIARLVHDVSGQPAGELEHATRRMLAAGWLVVEEVPSVIRRPPAPPASELEREPAGTLSEEPEREITHWIEIELVDDDGSPVPFERFELIGADGRRRGGRLDDRGFARVERLEDTSYEVRFPNLPPEACARA